MKTGRPKSNNPRSESLYIRLTTGEKDKLENYVLKNNLTKTQAVVKGLQLLFKQEEDR